jgi:hypothetical protein
MIYVEGNKGGDYLSIKPTGGNLLSLDVGHCCVVYTRAIVPVEILTALIGQNFCSNNPAEWPIDSWTSGFNEELRGQIKILDNGVATGRDQTVRHEGNVAALVASCQNLIDCLSSDNAQDSKKVIRAAKKAIRPFK